MEKRRSGDSVGATAGDARPDDPSNNKTTIGGAFNSGVTSSDPETRRDIEKQATMLEDQPPNANEEKIRKHSL